MGKKLETPTTYTFILAAVIGLALGGILSLLFGRYALPTKIPAQFTIGGFPVGELLANLIIVGVVGSLVFFGYVSMVVRDTAFPAAHPWLFVFETLLMGFIPASVVYVLMDFRDNGKVDLSSLNRDFILLAAKFGILHLLFQFSGVYTYMLEKKT
jgi:hypothetical protein